jgi:predicted nucleic acid-binding protein
MVLVDSSVWIEASRRDGLLEVKVALECLLGEYEAGLCPPVWLEVLGGARRQERMRLKKYLEILPFLAMHPDGWKDALALSWRLRDGGETIPWNDILIGAIALREGCRVYAVDGHFDAMAEMAGLLLYRPGYGGSYNPD